MLMSTENGVTIIPKYYFLSNLELCFKFLYQIEKKWLYFFTIHWAVFSQSAEMYKTVCLNPSLPQFQFHLEFCLI